MEEFGGDFVDGLIIYALTKAPKYPEEVPKQPLQMGLVSEL
jgi:hypothetical protein